MLRKMFIKHSFEKGEDQRGISPLSLQERGLLGCLLLTHNFSLDTLRPLDLIFLLQIVSEGQPRSPF